MSKVNPLPPGSRRSQNLEGYENLSLEDLEAAMADEELDPIAKKKAEEEARAAEEAADDGLDPNPDDEDEDDSEEVVEDADDADEDGEAEDEEPAEKAEEKKDEQSPLEKKIAALERQIKIEALERAKESEARKRAELLASRQAGRAGFLEQKLQESPSGVQRKTAAEMNEDEDAPADGDAAGQTRQEQDRPSPRPTQWDEDRAELVKMAINDEGDAFAKEHAAEFEEMPEKFISRLQELMKEAAAPYAEDFKTSSVKVVRKLARSCMNSAYATARIEFADYVAENAQAEAETRKAESVSKSKRRKAKAAISKGGRGAPKPPKHKSYEDMTDDELEAAFRAEYGDDYRAGADKGKHGGL